MSRNNLAYVFSCSMLAATAGCGGGGGGGGGGNPDAAIVDLPDAAFGPDAPPGNQDCTDGFGAWDGNDNVPASQSPPCNISPDKAPLFVSIGWDDNGDAAGMTWALDMLKERGVHNSFFMTSVYGQSAAVVTTWKRAKAEGHEIGNHTVSHLPNHGGRDFTADQWKAEIEPCSDFLTGSAAVTTQADLIGFRTPYLEYNDATLATVKAAGFWYDCSVEEGYEYLHDGSNNYWPYTLDNKSPGHTTQVEWTGSTLKELTPHPGLWELPTYAVYTPPDAKCAEYGLESGFRDRLKQRQDWFDTESGAITGFDYNLWASTNLGGFAMTKAEFVASLKYTFDQRVRGNHAPFLFGAHTAYYVDAWSNNASGTPQATDRQAAMEEFLDYVESKGGKVVSYKEVLDWLRKPKPLP